MSTGYSVRVARRGFVVTALASLVGLASIATVQAQLATRATAPDDGTGQSRMITFDSAGETNFALSVTADFGQRPKRATDLVIYVDTSASQTGVFQEDSIESLQTLLSNLHADDRVKIVAIDLDPIPLTAEFFRADSDEVASAVERLRQRTPLGSTDMKLMLTSAPEQFESAALRNRNVVYIGDGVSRGGIVHPDTLGSIVDRLVRNQISVSSFAIGPERNVELLSVLANHTGGNLYIDTDLGSSVKEAAVGLAETVHGNVMWPKQSQFNDSVVETFPTAFPPIRENRDTIVLGTLSNANDVALSIEGKVNGKSESLRFQVRPEASSKHYSFLPRMLRDARKNGGLTLTTVGSSGLLEYARVLGFQSQVLAGLGQQAMAAGDTLSAQRLAAAAMAVDPTNRTAQKLAGAPLVAKTASYRTKKQEEDSPFGGDDLFGGGEDATSVVEPAPQAEEASPFDAGGAAEETQPMPAESSPFDAQDDAGSDDLFGSGDAAPAEQPAGQLPPAPMVEQEPGSIDQSFEVLPVEPSPLPPPTEVYPPSGGGLNLIGRSNVDEAAIDRLMREEDPTANRLLLNEEQRRKVINDKVRKQVQFELKKGREELRTNPNAAIDRLKSMLGVLDSTTDVFPNNRRELRNRLESALLSSRQRKLQFDEQEAQRRLSQANKTAIDRHIARMAREEEQLSRLVNRFNSLMDEGNFEAARSVTLKARDLAPRNPATVVAAEAAERASTSEMHRRLSEEKQRNFSQAMYEIRKASVPFPANPLMVFPDAEEWKRKRIRRAKYDQIRLTGSANDEKILRALEQPATLDYEGDPWSDIEADLEEKYKINIVLTQSAKDDSLDEDTEITVNFRGIRLKNALRLMLKDQNAVFIVRDEVLQIISLDNAQDPENLVTNVYNVGDLVAPRFNPGGGLGGGGLGGGGGGQGGGQGGGGQGGGGQGGGGGGGVFCVQESGLTLTRTRTATETNVATTATTKTKKSQPTVLTLPATTSAGSANSWSEYFGVVFADSASVRMTVRELMQKQQTDEVVSLILAAIENDQRQDWMYEALTLAMQIGQRPQADVERALMSAVDLSSDVNDMMYAANYMANHGMEKRAIGLFEDIARAYPTRNEPVLLGLRAANRIEDVEGIRWATVGVLSHEWPDHPEVIKKAERSADALRLRLDQAGQTEALAAYETDLVNAKARDCVAKVSWTGDADLDIFVQEPGGTVCSRLKPRTSSGGVLSGDDFSAGNNQSGEMSEVYVLPKGFSGDYKLHVRRVWGEVTSGKVTVEIYSHYGTPQQAGEVRQLDLNDPGFSVAFNLQDGRRTESLEAHTIASVAEEQVAASRQILAQQLDGGGSSGSLVTGGLSDDIRDFERLQFARRRLAGPVGYRPIIETFFTGTSVQVNHATTADRLYVLVSVTPLFSDITDVFTFNTTADANDAQGGGAVGQ